MMDLGLWLLTPKLIPTDRNEALPKIVPDQGFRILLMRGYHNQSPVLLEKEAPIRGQNSISILHRAVVARKHRNQANPF